MIDQIQLRPAPGVFVELPDGSFNVTAPITGSYRATNGEVGIFADIPAVVTLPDGREVLFTLNILFVNNGTMEIPNRAAQGERLAAAVKSALDDIQF